MRAGLTLAAAAALTVAVAAPAAAQNRVSVVQGKAESMLAAGTPADEYDVNTGNNPTVACRSGTPLAVGWTGATAPVAATNVFLVGSDPYAQIRPRRPKAAGKIRAIAVCASGKRLKPTLKIAGTGTSVSCGAKLTLGLASSETWPYIETAIKIGPSGANGWTTDAGPQPRPTALCVARSAFTKVKTVRRTGTFGAGATSASVSATCGGAHRVLAWGYEAEPLPGNAWRSVESSSVRSVPFVSDATPTAGAKGFKLTVRAPDNAPATAAVPIALSLRCGVPAGR